MYNKKFTLYVLDKKAQRLRAEISIIEKRLEAKKALLERTKFEKMAQEYNLSKLLSTHTL